MLCAQTTWRRHVEASGRVQSKKNREPEIKTKGPEIEPSGRALGRLVLRGANFRMSEGAVRAVCDACWISGAAFSSPCAGGHEAAVTSIQANAACSPAAAAGRSACAAGCRAAVVGPQARAALRRSPRAELWSRKAWLLAVQFREALNPIAAELVLWSQLSG